MKSRKISITILVASLLLTGCGARNEKNGFLEVKKKTTVTTVTKASNPISGEASKKDKDEVDYKDNWWSDEKNSEKAEFETTTGIFTEPPIIIPMDTVTTITDVSTTVKQNTSGREENTEMPDTTSNDTTTISQNEKNIREVPDSILEAIQYWENIYPGIQIGFGLYNLDGSSGYEYNAHTPINSACTIKAAFAWYVLVKCEETSVDIYSTSIQYLPGYKDLGTSIISDTGTFYDWYTIDELLRLMLGESDNTAYTMLRSEFPINEMFQMIAPIGGQSDWNMWGSASVYQRKNEWINIYKYINSGSQYSDTLRGYLTNTNYCYLAEWMSGWHSYMHKSGWTDDEMTYPACNDCVIIDDSYLIVVMTQDYANPEYGHIDVVQSLGYYAETYYNMYGGDIF